MKARLGFTLLAIIIAGLTAWGCNDGGGSADSGDVGGSLDSGTPPDGVGGKDTGKPDDEDDATVEDIGDSDGQGGDADSDLDGGSDAGADAGIPSCGPSPTGRGGEMCLVPAGPFMMGCNADVDSECMDSEKPYHEVATPTFKIDKNDVTVSEYQRCVEEGGCTAAGTGTRCNFNTPGKENHPINCVDWDQTRYYCAWTGKRLPSEAEWEKAARGTDGRKYPWGNAPLDCDRAVHSADGCSNSSTAPVGSKPAGASPYGAEDMVGNVWQWMEDDWSSDYVGAPVDGSALVKSPRGRSRVMRGASWSTTITSMTRVSARDTQLPTATFENTGFRCAWGGD